MADFLASFNFGAQNDLRRDDGACLSVADLERRLRNTIQEKKTEVRAERINNVFNIAGTAEFTINATQTQTPNNGPVAIDPMLQGAEPMDVDMDNQAQSVIYTALSILRSQPSSNPSIQQAVATQIVAAASAADSSSWILHHTELTTMGWTFTYLCESSTTIWNMRNQHKVKVIVGDFSKRDPNPLLMSRPAFDCKGRLIISFPRKERQITVRYDHMPLHMTVADHMEFTKPPPMIGPQKPSKATLIEANRQAQKEAASAKRRANRLAKKQEAMEAQEAAIRDGIASPEKPRKEIQRKDAEAAEVSLVDQVRPALDDADVMQLQQAISYEEEQVENATAPAVTPTEHPVSKALIPDVTHEEERFEVEYATAPAVAPTEDPGSKAPILDVTHEEEQVENAIAPVVTPTEPPPSKALILNVTPEEAQRRMDVALRMLAEAGIDSATLSADQLTIFANQAPDLQKESLNMLITYGAERLQIIHPNDREALPSAPPPAAAPSVGDANEQNRTATTTQDSCPKDRPVCMVCQAAGYVCEYPPHPSSKRTCKSTAIVDESADVDMVADTRVEKEQVDYKQAPYHAAGAAQTHVENEDNEDEHGDDNDHGPLQQDFLQEEQAEQPDVDHYPTEQYSSFPSAPVNDFFSDMPNESVNGVYEQPPSLPYFQSASELELPQPDAVEEMPQSQLSPDLALQQSAAYFPTYNARSPNPASPQHAPPVTDIPPEHGEEHGEAPYSHHVRQNSNAAATSSSWSQGANTNDANATAKTSAPRIPSPIPHDFPEEQSLDQVAAALHMAQLEDAYLLAHAATSGQRYTSGPSVKMKQPVNHTPETAPVSQPPHDPWSTPQEGYRNADSASQRASRASEYPPDPISSSRNSNSNNDTHDHNHNHNQSHNHMYNINSSNHNHNSERNNTKNKIASSSSRISSSERRSRRGPTWSRLSGGASPPTNEPDKIGYKPYSFRKGTSSDSDSDQPSDLHETGGSTAETTTGVYESVTTQSNSWAEDCEQDAVDDTRPGSSHQGHQNHQHQSHSGHQRNENHQTHQSHQTHQARQNRQSSQRHQQQSQQRQGFEWGLHDSWTRGH
ncbi:hypothetical protein E4U30_004041 [Claviceps sp. LM220 group G6]|nr:hypothetical protein E4U30_004041 [Claviceps sp. LM220 group G6]